MPIDPSWFEPGSVGQRSHVMRVMMESYLEQIPADHRDLSVARSAIGAWISRQLRQAPPSHQAGAAVSSDTVVGDVEMVVSELAANVIDHTDSAWMQLAIELDADRAVITVTNPSSSQRVPRVEHWGSLDEGDRGRGLRIVRALCDSIQVIGDDDSTSIRCGIPLRRSSQGG